MQLWEKFRPGEKPPAELGANRDWNIDLVPKFIMANGKLVKALLHTGVTRYMDFKAVDGSYVVNKGTVKKVPATDAEALTTNLVGFFEKRRLRSFFMCVAQLFVLPKDLVITPAVARNIPQTCVS
jgi:Rab GDP dissociation inhibitor